jgi:hypothetical protein
MPLNEDEQAILNHWGRWGSDGYPVSRVGSHHWTWGPWRSIQGPPVVFPTKRAAVASFEAYIAILIDKKAGRL